MKRYRSPLARRRYVDFVASSISYLTCQNLKVPASLEALLKTMEDGGYMVYIYKGRRVADLKWSKMAPDCTVWRFNSSLPKFSIVPCGGSIRQQFRTVWRYTTFNFPASKRSISYPIRDGERIRRFAVGFTSNLPSQSSMEPGDRIKTALVTATLPCLDKQPGLDQFILAPKVSLSF